MLKTVGNPSTRYGDQTVVGGNVVIGTAGKGVDFSADPHAPGMTSELFDDYEEGTWTPRPVPPTGSITTYTSVGKYTKVGRLVTVTFNVVVSNVGTATNLVYIADLPFTAASGNDEAVAAMREQALTGLMWSGTVKASTTVINTFRYDNNNPIANNFNITGSVTYVAA